jgi:hypothetical protein
MADFFSDLGVKEIDWRVFGPTLAAIAVLVCYLVWRGKGRRVTHHDADGPP